MTVVQIPWPQTPRSEPEENMVKVARPHLYSGAQRAGPHRIRRVQHASKPRNHNHHTDDDYSQCYEPSPDHSSMTRPSHYPGAAPHHRTDRASEHEQGRTSQPGSRTRQYDGDKRASSQYPADDAPATGHRSRHQHTTSQQ